MTNQPARAVSLADWVYDRLEEEILNGSLPAGQILTEGKLAERLGVSRTPIREAVRRLEQEQLLDERGKGVVVRGIREQDVAEIFEIRRHLEVLATVRCAEKMDSEDLDELRLSVEMLGFFTSGMTSSNAKSLQLQRYDSAFHRTIYCGCGNRTMGDFLSMLHRKLSRYRTVSVQDSGRAERMYAEHMAIYKAIEAHNTEEAGRLALLHIDNAANHILKE